MSKPTNYDYSDYGIFKLKLNNISEDKVKIEDNNDKENENNDKENINISNDNYNLNSINSKELYYNYLESEKNQNDEAEDETYSKSLEEIIRDLKAENSELRNDMKKLYFLTQENKNNLMEHIQLLKNENYKLKNEKKDLEYKLLVNESINNELKADNEKYANENKIIQQKYLNEIKELNCQLTNYKIKLNNLTLNYDQLLNDFHYIKKENIFQMSEPDYSYSNKKKSNTDENNYENKNI
jgi:hypothetical protein